MLQVHFQRKAQDVFLFSAHVGEWISLKKKKKKQWRQGKVKEERRLGCVDKASGQQSWFKKKIK